MIQKYINKRTSIEKNTSVEGETIEKKILRIVENKEPITDGAPIIYTDRREGVLAGYNIRTDRFDVAIDGMDYVTRSQIAKRDEYYNSLEQSSDNTSDSAE